jgi:hypothetical protein
MKSPHDLVIDLARDLLTTPYLAEAENGSSPAHFDLLGPVREPRQAVLRLDTFLELQELEPVLLRTTLNEYADAGINTVSSISRSYDQGHSPRRRIRPVRTSLPLVEGSALIAHSVRWHRRGLSGADVLITSWQDVLMCWSQ